MVNAEKSIFYFVLFELFLKSIKAYVKRYRSLLDRKKKCCYLIVSLKLLICKWQCIWKLEEKCMDNDDDFSLYRGFEVNRFLFRFLRFMSK